ncbi:MAG: ABC-type transport auxiliary lipoprotein family protein [Candidatus Acidiferrum sp.]
MNATNSMFRECHVNATANFPIVTRFITNTRAGIALLLFCVMIAGGCGAARPNKYYQLTVPGDSAAASANSTNGFTLVIGPMVATHLYKEDHIVYSTGGTELGTYEYQRWAEPPAEMIGEVVLRELRTSGHYKSVYTQRSDIHGDYLLRGRLYDFKEISSGSIVARVTAEWELKDLKTGATVWTHYYTHDEPVVSKDVPAVVAALDRNVQRGVEELKGGLDQYLASATGK